MNIERENTGALTARLKLKLSPADYTPGVEHALKEQRRNTNWPGFRPGQVPMAIVKKRVGKALLVNEVERLIGQSLNDYIHTNKLRVLGQPLPSNDSIETNNWDSPGEFNFQYEMGLAPEVEIELNEKMGVTYPVVDVNDELVNKEVADMLRRYGRLEDAERSEGKDMLLGDLIELDGTGGMKEGGLMNRTTISLEFLKDEGTRQRLTGKEKGEEVKVDPHKVSDGHDDLARMLGVGHDRVHDLQGEMLFRIAEIKRMIPAELGQELFDRVHGKDEVKDESTFRGRVKERLERMFRRDSDRIFKRLVINQLVEKNKPELPVAFLKRWIMETSEKPVTLGEIEESWDSTAAGLKRQLIEDRVLEKYGLEAKSEEIQAFARSYVADQFAQYGMPPPEGQKLQEMAGRMLGDREQVKRMRDSIVEQKLIVHFKNMISPKENRIGYEEFVNLARTT